MVQETLSDSAWDVRRNERLQAANALVFPIAARAGCSSIIVKNKWEFFANDANEVI